VPQRRRMPGVHVLGGSCHIASQICRHGFRRPGGCHGERVIQACEPVPRSRRAARLVMARCPWASLDVPLIRRDTTRSVTCSETQPRSGSGQCPLHQRTAGTSGQAAVSQPSPAAARSCPWQPAPPPRSTTGPSAPICIATGTVAGAGTNATPGHVASIRPDDARGIPKIWVRAERAPKARLTEREHLDRGAHLGDENGRHRISAGRPVPGKDVARPGYATNRGMTPCPVVP
jgi:hypothetical protein